MRLERYGKRVSIPLFPKKSLLNLIWKKESTLNIAAGGIKFLIGFLHGSISFFISRHQYKDTHDINRETGGNFRDGSLR